VCKVPLLACQGLLIDGGLAYDWLDCSFRNHHSLRSFVHPFFRSFVRSQVRSFVRLLRRTSFSVAGHAQLSFGLPDRGALLGLSCPQLASFRHT